MTWPVTSAESVEANQTMTGATQPGENFSPDLVGDRRGRR